MKLESYWPAIAQVIPVLGLALIVEARQVWKRWDEYRPVAKPTLMLMYGLPLLAFVVTEMTALTALEGQHVWNGWPSVANNTISAALTILLLGPVIAYLSIASRRALVRQYFRALFVQVRVKNRFTVHRMRRTVHELQQMCQAFDRQIEHLNEVEKTAQGNVEELHAEKRRLLATKSKAEDAKRLLEVFIKRADDGPKLFSLPKSASTPPDSPS